MADGKLSKIGERFRQLGLAFNATRKVDRKLIPMMFGVGLVVWTIPLLIGVFVTVRPFFWAITGFPIALMSSLIVFGRRASRAQIQAIEGQPGAAAALLQSMRGMWTVEPAVAFTRKEDFVHRVVGRPGVVLVGEGSPARVKQLLRQEHRRVGRAIGDTPVHEVSVGHRDDQVPLSKLQSHVTRLPRKLKPRQVGAVENRLQALRDQQLPLPKGPLPKQIRGKFMK